MSVAAAVARTPSGVRRAAVRVAGMAAAVLLVATVHVPGRPPSLCVLRTLTGIPCPFCGGTTAAVHLGHGDLGAALSASPLAVFLIAWTPVAGIAPMPRWWQSRRLRRAVVLGTLAVAELWQLARFGLLPLHT